jgi:diaminohydroxyphosphoribosylaminopyrimidine deaminase / 5-amino-6-(5-phosphoribosylamino)uracil reductase
VSNAWRIVLAAAREADRLTPSDPSADVVVDDVRLAWHPETGWQADLPASDERNGLIDLYLPICSATAARPITVGHLGQSLDGFIATHAGESRWVTGEENLLHMHRLRALCDAVVVGAGTVAADDPQLTTRLVEGSSPLRVVLDPARRLTPDHRVFNDASAETLYVCAESLIRPGERHFGRADVIGIRDAAGGGVGATDLTQLLRARGCARVFVEGGGVTVSMFLEANLLDRLHVTVAPLLIGDGRPAIRLPPRAALGDCHRPRYRVFRMGGDVLFDLDIESHHASSHGNQITRVI